MSGDKQNEAYESSLDLCCTREVVEHTAQREYKASIAPNSSGSFQETQCRENLCLAQQRPLPIPTLTFRKA
jgi:hypothetical protein